MKGYDSADWTQGMILLSVISAWESIFESQHNTHVTNRSGSIHKIHIVLCNCITILLQMSSTACKLYIGHRSVMFICRSAVKHFNCKWPLYSVSADHAYDNCGCKRGTEDCQKKQSDRDQGIAYHQRILKLSGRKKLLNTSVSSTKRHVLCLRPH